MHKLFVLAVVVMALVGCGRMHVGLGVESYYPDKTWGKELGDPRRLNDGGVSNNGGLHIGGFHRLGGGQ